MRLSHHLPLHADPNLLCTRSIPSIHPQAAPRAAQSSALQRLIEMSLSKENMGGGVLSIQSHGMRVNGQKQRTVATKSFVDREIVRQNHSAARTHTPNNYPSRVIETAE
jgi:hypothetical protein